MRSAWADGADRAEEGETKAHHGAPEQPTGKPGKPITVKRARDPDGHYDGASVPTLPDETSRGALAALKTGAPMSRTVWVPGGDESLLVLSGWAVVPVWHAGPACLAHLQPFP